MLCHDRGGLGVLLTVVLLCPVQATYTHRPLLEGKFKTTSYLAWEPLLQVTLNFLTEEAYQVMISLSPFNVVPANLTCEPNSSFYELPHRYCTMRDHCRFDAAESYSKEHKNVRLTESEMQTK
jgi:hypothetical protein